MTSQRSQFAADGGLVEHEENNGEIALISEAVEQGAQGGDEVCWTGISLHVAAVLLMDFSIMIAHAAR